ncbi:hypothetical protein Hypma_001932, partial [Hypsizygus marmoreus]
MDVFLLLWLVAPRNTSHVCCWPADTGWIFRKGTIRIQSNEVDWSFWIAQYVTAQQCYSFHAFTDDRSKVTGTPVAMEASYAPKSFNEYTFFKRKQPLKR